MLVNKSKARKRAFLFNKICIVRISIEKSSLKLSKEDCLTAKVVLHLARFIIWTWSQTTTVSLSLSLSGVRATKNENLHDLVCLALWDKEKPPSDGGANFVLLSYKLGNSHPENRIAEQSPKKQSSICEKAFIIVISFPALSVRSFNAGVRH